MGSKHGSNDRQMTRDEELNQLERIRRLLANKKAVNAISDAIPEHVSLDLFGASFEANAKVCNMHGIQFGSVKSPRPSDAVYAMVIAAFCRSRHRCPHLLPSEVVHIFLAPRVGTCQSCIIDFADVFSRHDTEKPRPDECDLCLKSGIAMFSNFTLQFANAILYGDACDECVSLINPKSQGATT